MDPIPPSNSRISDANPLKTGSKDGHSSESGGDSSDSDVEMGEIAENPLSEAQKSVLFGVFSAFDTSQTGKIPSNLVPKVLQNAGIGHFGPNFGENSAESGELSEIEAIMRIFDPESAGFVDFERFCEVTPLFLEHVLRETVKNGAKMAVSEVFKRNPPQFVVFRNGTVIFMRDSVDMSADPSEIAEKAADFLRISLENCEKTAPNGSICRLNRILEAEFAEKMAENGSKMAENGAKMDENGAKRDIFSLKKAEFEAVFCEFPGKTGDFDRILTGKWEKAPENGPFLQVAFVAIASEELEMLQSPADLVAAGRIAGDAQDGIVVHIEGVGN